MPAASKGQRERERESDSFLRHKFRARRRCNLSSGLQPRRREFKRPARKGGKTSRRKQIAPRAAGGKRGREGGGEEWRKLFSPSCSRDNKIEFIPAVRLREISRCHRRSARGRKGRKRDGCFACERAEFFSDARAGTTCSARVVQLGECRSDDNSGFRTWRPGDVGKNETRREKSPAQ